MGKALKSVGKGFFGESSTGGESIETMSKGQKEATDKAFTQYGQMLDNPDAGVQEQINQQITNARSGAEDQNRQAQQMIASRGLGNTSFGLSALMSGSQGLNDKINAIRAQAPMLRQQNLGFASGGIGNLLGVTNQSKLWQQGTPGTSGMLGTLVSGLASGAGKGAGAMMGAG